MEKNLVYGTLLEFYGELLTHSVKNILELYFNQDFSLREIADEKKITRQAVMDSIARGTNKLDELENKLMLYKKYSEMMEIISKTEEVAKNSEQAREINLLLARLKQILEDK